MPTTGPGKRLHALLARAASVAFAIPRALRRPGSPVGGDARILHAFYDLKVAPVTFDFLWFLAGADLRRRQLGLEGVRVVIVPGSHAGLRRERFDYEDVVTIEARRQRIDEILVPACGLLPSCVGVARPSSRREAAQMRGRAGHLVYPTGYEPTLPIYPGPLECLEAARQGEAEIGVLRARREDLEVARGWLESVAGGRKTVTITLRAYNYMPARNSDLAAWTEFARRLDPTHFVPVVVPDSAQSLDDLPADLRAFPVYLDAAHRVGLRMALYELAYLNLGVNNGPMGLCWLDDRTRYVTFKMSTPTVPQTTHAYLRSLGFEPGQSLPFATAGQLWCWEDDGADTLWHEFEAAVRRIEAAGSRLERLDSGGANG